MQIYSQKSEYTLLQGNMLDMGDFVGGGTIDSIVTDPPYELNFMGKGWDNSGIAFQKETWEKCLEALKPGGYLLAFGGSRTYHRIACAIEDAGFEIRDCIMRIYGSGFPKSMNIEKSINKIDGVEFKSKPAGGVGFMNTDNDGYHNTINQLEQVGESSERAKQRAGWGTSLKPSYEPIIVARKPLEGSCTDNVIKYGVGGINIDECRVDTQDDLYRKPCENGSIYSQQETKYTTGTMSDNYKLGRFPANTILTYDESDFEEVCGGFPNTNPSKRIIGGANRKSYTQKEIINPSGWKEVNRIRKTEGYDDNGGSASRYFYCAKASKRDRDEGLDGFETKKTGELQGGRKEGSAGSIMQNADGGTRVNPYAGTGTPKKNIHPTVKPCDLMQYLVRLVTPNGGTVLDPFNGSGSTGKAVMYENKDRNKNYKYIGIELTEEYLPIAKARIEYVINKGIEKEKSEPKQEEQTKQRKESALF